MLKAHILLRGVRIGFPAFCMATAMLFVASDKEAMAAERMSITTGPNGGIYYTIGGVWAELMNKKTGIRITPEIGKAGRGNVLLVSNKQANFAVNGDAISYEGYKGIGWSTKKAYTGIRNIAPMGYGYFQWWSRADRANAKTISDLKGLTLGLAAPGGVIDVWGRKVLAYFKVPDFRVVNAPHVQLTSMMSDNLVQVHGTFAGVPHPAATEQASRFPLNFIGFTEAEITAFTKEYPYVVAGMMPANSYKGQAAPVRTLVSYDTISTHKDTDEEIVYKLTKATYENREALHRLHKAISAIDAESIGKLSVPYHAGAVRYYREVGIKLPSNLIPPEAK